MGQNDWTFWTAGVAVAVESPKIEDTITILREGRGTNITQYGGTNWFHFAIPTPNQLDGNENVNLESVFIKATLDHNVSITAVDVWIGSEKLQTPTLSSPLYGPNVYHQVGLGHSLVRDPSGCWRPVTVCIQAAFEKDGGTILFEGAGATFEKP